jgi:hypothetical protein
MTNDAKSKRLDKIELQLTPKQWAIRLADEMRRYASEEDFLKAILKGTYLQSQFRIAFFALAQQAKLRWPEDIQKEEKLNRKLRMEFQALMMLMNNINRRIQIDAETNRLKGALQLSKLQTLILKNSLAYTGLVETSSSSQARLHLLPLLEDWADDSAKLLMEEIAYKNAVQIIQESYLESHAFLYSDNEIAFETAMRAVRDAIAQFNEYLKVKAILSSQESDRQQQDADMANDMLLERERSLTINIDNIEKCAENLVDLIVQMWVKEAKLTANVDILRETGKHEDFIWEQFRKKMGLEP